MEDENQTNLNGKPFLPLAVGLVGVLLGASALFFAINAASRASSIEETYRTSFEKAAATSIEMANVNRKMETVTANLEDIKSAGMGNVESLRRETQSAIVGLQNYIKENRTLIAKNQEAIKEIASRTPAAKAAAETPEAAATPSASADGAKKHTVKPGENFSVIAKKYGKSLADIEKANPNIDSRRLQVGQEVIIP